MFENFVSIFKLIESGFPYIKFVIKSMRRVLGWRNRHLTFTQQGIEYVYPEMINVF